jgi:hypothetical protein
MHPFTPPRRAERPAVLLCMACRRLTIVLPARPRPRPGAPAEHAA